MSDIFVPLFAPGFEVIFAPIPPDADPKIRRAIVVGNQRWLTRLCEICDKQKVTR